MHGCWITAAIHSLPLGFEDQVSGVGFQLSGLRSTGVFKVLRDFPLTPEH
jgi:hypothetical protein